MQDYGNGKLVFSASDLTGASDCNWAAVRKIDKKLGFDIEIPSDAGDGMLARTGELGNVHEEKQLQKYRNEFGDQVVELGRPDYKSSVPLEQQMVELTKLTVDALETKRPVVFQGTFFDGVFQGFADFLILQDDGSYAVYDTKLARKAKITALVQIASYADQLMKMGIPVARHAHLILGDNSLSSHNLEDIMPLYLKKRQDMIEVIAARMKNKEQGGIPIQWNDETYPPCGKCVVCEPEIERTDDVISVAGLRMEQRAKLRADGISTLEDLATTDLKKITDMSSRTFASLKSQARVQLATRNSANKAQPYFELFDSQALSVIPASDDGDIFFDFEGDPLYSEGSIWGIDYLFGWVDKDKEFSPLWAHNLEQEKVAFFDFVSYIKERRALYPKMHIYHYAAYEKTHLLSLAARYGVEEDYISQLLIENVLVDLYPIVRRAVLIGSYSYSLKKLEPIFVTNEERAGVTNAADSVVEYANYCDMVSNNELEKAELKLKEIEDYNAYDCRSTLGLRNWLMTLAKDAGVELRGIKHAAETELEEIEQDPLCGNLMSLISNTPLGDRTPDHTAIALTAAAIDFHRREKKSFWWEHFSRLENPMDEWENDKDVYVVEKCEVVSDWAVPASARAKLKRRTIKIHTKPAPGSKVSVGDARWLLYPADAASIPGDENPGFLRVVKRSVVTEVEGDSVLHVEESLPTDVEPYNYVPLAVVPGQPIDTRNLEAAIKEWGEKVLAEYPNLKPDPALDILRRRPPSDSALEELDVNASYETIIKAIRNINNSFLAIQGPPGAGKSFNGGKVIGDLVMKHGWKVGVVGQSHSTVENLLKSIHKNGGVPADLIAKPGSKTHDEGEDKKMPWVIIDKGSKKTREYREFIDGKSTFVIGGTAWDLANRERIGFKELDLLVIDEAGQFSLANTIAVSSAAKRLLLLGDPQQLPQVTQGMHPEPVDGSALGWLAGNDEVLSQEFGYFLPSTYRMTHELCNVVSSNWYESRLGSVAPVRSLELVEPGFYPVPIEHFGNSTESVAEADKVVEIVGDLQNRNWNDGGKSGRLNDAHENIIVVAPYNAQVQLIRKKLDAAGFTSIPVGTVDKFQGQEAAVAIISMTASSAHETPRGIEFLLMPNRLNVAISRAKWAAYLVYSPRLLDYKPTNVDNLRLISKFINLVWKAK